MKNEVKKIKIIFGVFAFFFLFQTVTFSAINPTEGSGLPRDLDLEKTIQTYGYSTDTQEQIKEATRDKNFVARSIAVNLLAQKYGKQSIPIIKTFLDDSELRVRLVAANSLGTLGDKSGLKQMQKDFEVLNYDKGAPFKPDANIKDAEEIKILQVKRASRIQDALRVAKVLAELGDRRGYNLAVEIALNEHSLGNYLPISVLSEIVKTNKATLKSEGLDPVFVLKAIGESETDEGVSNVILNYAATILPEEIGIEILDVMTNSTKLPENKRFYAKWCLDKIKNGERESLKSR